MTLLDPVLLARIQFAFTVSFHIVFPAMSIGLASFLAVVEGCWLKTGDQRFKDIYKFWVKIFAVTFGMGVVSGVVMSYEFGTNWSVFSDKVGNILGPLLGYEVLTAFFLEASFLGIMLFGWGRVSQRMHFVSTCIVAIGTLISAFWILAANSWMQTPQGFTIAADERFYPTMILKNQNTRKTGGLSSAGHAFNPFTSPSKLCVRMRLANFGISILYFVTSSF